MLCCACEHKPEVSPVVEDTPANITTAPYIRQVAYTHQHLDAIGKTLIPLSKNEKFMQALYAAFDEAAGEDKEILLTDLADHCRKNDLDLFAEMQNSIINSVFNIKMSINAFDGIENKNWPIKIYIPNYNYLKKINAFEHQDIAFFSYAGEENIGEIIHRGYIFKYGNQYKELMVSEKYASTNPVFVIGLSEILNNKSDEYYDNKSINKARPSGTRLDAAFKGMLVKEHREDWAGGASEIALNGVVTWYNLTGTNPYNPPAPYNESALYSVGEGVHGLDQGGENIREFSRSEVKDKKWKDFTKALVRIWNPYWYPVPGYKDNYDRDADHAFYIVYEADAWPSSIRTAEWDLGSANGHKKLYIGYRSSDGYYNKGIVTANSSKINNSNGDRTISNFEIPYYYLNNWPITGGG